MASPKKHHQSPRTELLASHSVIGSGTTSAGTANAGISSSRNQPNRGIGSRGILLLLALILVLPPEHATLRNNSETVSQSLRTAFSSLNHETFATSGSTSAYASGLTMEFYQLEEQEIVLPLSRPGEPGRLNLNTTHGSVQISGYDGEDVVVRYDGHSGRQGERQEPPEGMRRITDSAPGFEATEDDNVITIRNESLFRGTRFNIMVPHNFAINVNLVKADTLLVSSISGDIEINQVSGGVSLIDVSGAALINTFSGDIVTVFESVPTDKPMSFNTLSGDIDLSFPSGSRFTARLRSEFGEMFTDFDMDVREDASQREHSSNDLRIAISETVIADVNGGGPDYRITTLRGNIYLREK